MTAVIIVAAFAVYFVSGECAGPGFRAHGWGMAFWEAFCVEQCVCMCILEQTEPRVINFYLDLGDDTFA